MKNLSQSMLMVAGHSSKVLQRPHTQRQQLPGADPVLATTMTSQINRNHAQGKYFR